MTKILVDKAVIEQALEALSNTGTQRGREPQQFHAEGKSIEALHSALQQPQVEQGPDAWLHSGGKTQPLYLYQQPRQPLTEMEIVELRQLTPGTLDVQFVKFARAVEAAHGIGESNA